ncbi:hypothetical protein K504DRAFT_459409 [Pleomassaria siparia CBS 279.74]|uniref:Uncharacterized protein n=1 Tax=Pleomassaria siparia CBS 279.74 TaxID=1314801 RepID=A0A6G1K2K2_9PLEO|nr:hypothetical protein K504DRAFT_459409 [Pleomassaria siparia CBS 279.74]
MPFRLRTAETHGSSHPPRSPRLPDCQIARLKGARQGPLLRAIESLDHGRSLMTQRSLDARHAENSCLDPTLM